MNPEYEKVYKMDENQLVFETNAKIKNATNFDPMAEVYNELKPKEKEYIQTASKTYLK